MNKKIDNKAKKLEDSLKTNCDISLNKVILIGYVAEAPKVEYAWINKQWRQIATFPLATTERDYIFDGTQMQERTVLHGILFYGEGDAEFAAKHIKYGSLLCIEGKLKTRQLDKKNGDSGLTYEVWCHWIDLMDVPDYYDYLNLFLNNIEFAKTYISMYYPFKYQYLIDNWSYLAAGDAHYCVYMNDTSTIYSSKFGLSYNKNIRWNSKLKAKYEFGIWNPFIGELWGIDRKLVDDEDEYYLDDMIPLDKKYEIELRKNAFFLAGRHDCGFYYDNRIEREICVFDDSPVWFFDSESIFADYDYLEFSEFKSIFEENKLIALLNDSIWEKTLKFFIDENFCNHIISKLKELEKQEEKPENNKKVSEEISTPKHPQPENIENDNEDDQEDDNYDWKYEEERVQQDWSNDDSWDWERETWYALTDEEYPEEGGDIDNLLESMGRG